MFDGHVKPSPATVAAMSDADPSTTDKPSNGQAAPIGPAVHVQGHDHIVLKVVDPGRSLAWYRDNLGLAPEREEEWRSGLVAFPSLRIDDTTLIDLLQSPPTGTNVDHFSLRIDDCDLDALAESGRFVVLDGPNLIWGATGWGIGLYVADPDGNMVELKRALRPDE